MVRPGPVGSAIVSGRDWLPALPALSVTETATVKLPAAPGVPEIVPLPASRLNPCGREPGATFQEYGVVPPVAARVAEYGDPAVPCGREVVVMVTTGPACV